MAKALFKDHLPGKWTVVITPKIGSRIAQKQEHCFAPYDDCYVLLMFLTKEGSRLWNDCQVRTRNTNFKQRWELLRHRPCSRSGGFDEFRER
ncbi:hypothetical protein KOR42_47390 [Thalassoglobus neptunius]|uniref:Uncharacterized protein n=1 Tax=Thalassoglobus neptunius TaxID=1938619 RepID=A0A5C5VWG2_9PLAN|nr:hypothetical protein KOR42_47390 [Thalassoglobus neptunius]